MSNYEDVKAFHAKLGLPVGDRPRLLEPSDYKFREDFLIEELTEFRQAHARGDLADVADALVDLAYVVLGTALWMGLDWEAHWAAVQAANMAKERGQGRRGHTYDAVKPPGWRPPDHQAILRAALDCAHAQGD